MQLKKLAVLQMAEEAGNSVAGDKKAKFCSKEYDVETGLAYFTFGDPNKTVLEFDSNKCTAEITKQLMLHGAIQKIGDSFAGVKGDFAKGIENARGVIEALLGGNWGVERDDAARPRLAELAEAIARIKNVPLEKATAAVEAATDEQRATWRGNMKVKSVIATMRAEKAAAALEASAEKELEVAIPE